MKRIIQLVVLAALLAIGAICLTSCKATRTITSTATYTLVTDTSKVTTTINTKTVEDYTGIKK